MKHAAAFAFNKSHSYAYGTLAYTTAFLKANWPVEYGAAVLGVATRDDKRQQAFDDLADDGIPVLPASVNDSDAVSAAVEGGAIRLGLAEVKGVGTAADAIVAQRRRGGPFRSLPDLVRRVTIADGTGSEQPLPIDAVQALIEAGACDEFGSRLGQLQVVRAVHSHPGVPVPIAEWGALERAQRERARTGATLTGHPLRLLASQLRQWRAPGAVDGSGQDLGMRPTPVHQLPAAGNALTIGLVTEYGERGYSRGRMATLTLEGSGGRLRGVIWDQVLTELQHRGTVPSAGRVVAVRGRITSGKRTVATETTGETDDLEPVEQVPAREIMISNVFPLDIDDQPRTWVPSAAPSITDLWTARRSAGGQHPVIAEPEPAPTPLRTTEPDPPTPASAGLHGTIPTIRPIPPQLEAPTAMAAPAHSRDMGSPAVVDLLTIPTGIPLRRAWSSCPDGPALLARYPALATRDAGRSIAAASPGSRSGLLPAGDSGSYLVVLIAEEREAAAVVSLSTGLGRASSADAAEATARRMLAAHIDGMASRKALNGPVAPVTGQLPLFTVPGQLPEPPPAAVHPERPTATAPRRGTAA